MVLAYLENVKKGVEFSSEDSDATKSFFVCCFSVATRDMYFPTVSGNYKLLLLLNAVIFWGLIPPKLIISMFGIHPPLPTPLSQVYYCNFWIENREDLPVLRRYEMD